MGAGRRAILALCALLAVVLPLAACDITANHLSKRQIKMLVENNAELLQQAGARVEELGAVTAAHIERSPIYFQDHPEIEGVYIVRRLEDRSLAYEACDDALLAEALALKGLREISSSASEYYFECGGRGFGSASVYYGFQYSQRNPETIIAIEGGSVSRDGNGWRWQQDEGDNRVYIEPIIENFFYFERYY